MKNINPEMSDYFDKFPKQNPMHRHRRDGTKSCDCRVCGNRYRNKNFPYKAFHSFLKNRLGSRVSFIFNEFKFLEWIPIEHRTWSRFCQSVETNTFIEKNENSGRIKFNSDCSVYNRAGEYYIDECRYKLFYVHPSDKILCLHNPKKIRYKKKTNDNFIVLGNYNQLVKLRGIWYRVWINDLNVVKYLKGSDQIIYEDNGNSINTKNNKLNFTGIEVYKKQLDSKTLKLMGLKND